MTNTYNSVNLAELVRWVWNHPQREQTFTGWTIEQLTAELAQSADNDQLAITMFRDQFSGLVLFSADSDTKLLEIRHILTIMPRVTLACFVQLGYSRFSSYTVIGNHARRERPITITYERLYKMVRPWLVSSGAVLMPHISNQAMANN